MPKYDFNWDHGHNYGWIFYRENEALAELEYANQSYESSMVFRVNALSRNKKDLQLLNKRDRLNRDDLYYKNQKLDMIVFDIEFNCNTAPPYEQLSLKDFRNPPLVFTIFDKIKIGLKKSICFCMRKPFYSPLDYATIYGHRYGWVYCKDNQELAALEFIGLYKDGWFLFDVHPLVKEHRKIKDISNLQRRYDEGFYIKNCRTGMNVYEVRESEEGIILDGNFLSMFLFGNSEKLLIKDFRV